MRFFYASGGDILACTGERVPMDEALTMLQCSQSKSRAAAMTGEIEAKLFFERAVADLNVAILAASDWSRAAKAS